MELNKKQLIEFIKENGHKEITGSVKKVETYVYEVSDDNDEVFYGWINISYQGDPIFLREGCTLRYNANANCIQRAVRTDKIRWQKVCFKDDEPYDKYVFVIDETPTEYIKRFNKEHIDDIIAVCEKSIKTNYSFIKSAKASMKAAIDDYTDDIDRYVSNIATITAKIEQLKSSQKDD